MNITFNKTKVSLLSLITLAFFTLFNTAYAQDQTAETINPKPPVITSISPNYGYAPAATGGEEVTITGANFSGNIEDIEVYFGNVKATTFTVVDEMIIIVNVPPLPADMYDETKNVEVDVTVVTPARKSAITPVCKFYYNTLYHPLHDAL